MATSRTYVRCRQCGAHRDDGASLSKRGLCTDCGKANLVQENDDMHHHRGEYFKRWRRAMAASVGGVLVDDVLDAE